MSQKPETRFAAQVKDRLEEIPRCWFFKTQMLSRLGIPDIVGTVNGQFFALELKVGKNKATLLQQHVLKKIAEAGGFTDVTYPENLTETINHLRRFLHEKGE